MRVVFFGDSLTEGVDGVSYLRLLHERIHGAGTPSGVELINAGVGGDTVVNLARRLAADVVPHHPDWVVVFVGTNDCATALIRPWLPTPQTRGGLRYFRGYKQVLHPVTPARFRDSLRLVVDQLVERTGARIALCTPPTLGESPRARRWRWLDRYAAVTRLVAAERGCDLIDVRAAFVGAIAELPPRPLLAPLGALWVRKRPDDPYDYERLARLRGLRLTYDGTHFTQRGAALVADLMYAWLCRISPKVDASTTG
jgi:lysophospholipase L1-like esterase